MHLKSLCVLAAAAFVLTACNKAETPAEVARDVEKAQADGQREVADARADVQQANADADKQVADAIADHDGDDVARQAHDANETFDKGKSKIVLAQAEADHKVATEKCDGLEGPAQRDCKDSADKAFDQAKQAAKVNR
jgi:predicted lipid-binding transport protein (Tim44 family)